MLFTSLLTAAWVALVVGEVSSGNLNQTRFLDVHPQNTTESVRVGTLGSDGDFDPKKVASQALWEYYVRKGAALSCAMKYSDAWAGEWIGDTRTPPSAASIWRGDLREEMRRWGWNDFNAMESTNCEFHNEGTYPHETAFEELGLDADPTTNGGHNSCFKVEHWDDKLKDENGRPIPGADQYYQVDGLRYRSTKAQYSFAMNKIDGAIFGQNLFGPAFKAEQNWGRKPSMDELPKLRSLSDVLWGFWNRDNDDIQGLRIYGALWIANDDTRKLAASALASRNRDKLDRWPGLQFGTDTPEGKALLGSPIGATIAYFLMQHKAELGNKVVTKITLLREEGPDGDLLPPDPNLFFRIEDAPVQTPPDPAPSPLARRSERVEKVSRDGKNLLRVHMFHL